MTDIVANPEVFINDARTKGFETLSENGFTTQKITEANADLWLQMGQLRGEVYAEKKYITEDDLDEHAAEYNRFDDQAEHFVAVDDDGTVVGTVRVISRTADALLLPAEEDFGYELPIDAQEISRLIREPELSATDGLLVSLALMRAALKATAGTSEKVYAVLEQKLHRQLSVHVGIHLRTLGDPIVMDKYNDTLNSLVEMQPRLITSQIHERDVRVRRHAQNHKALSESLLGKPFAPFFERDVATQGLGRVRISDFSSSNPDQFERNAPFVSKEQQAKLGVSTVSLAGVGGDGGELAIALAKLGVRYFRVADPEFFGVENLNRQAGASYATIGHNKAEVIADMLRDLGAVVTVYPGGITAENIDEFVEGADLIADETEFTMPELGVMLARSARRYNVPTIMTLNVGFGSYTTSFDPNGMKFEEYLGLDADMPLDQIAKQEVSLSKWAPHIPSYADTNLLTDVQRGVISTPTVVPGVLIAAGDATTQALAHLVAGIEPSRESWIKWAPHGKAIDVIDGSIEVKSRARHFALSVAIAALRTKFGKN